jgi:hypothetical protein
MNKFVRASLRLTEPALSTIPWPWLALNASFQESLFNALFFHYSIPEGVAFEHGG